MSGGLGESCIPSDLRLVYQLAGAESGHPHQAAEIGQRRDRGEVLQVSLQIGANVGFEPYRSFDMVVRRSIGGSGYTVGSSSSSSVSVSDNDATPQPSSCVTADAALMSQVEAKVTRHRDVTGRTDLHEMFSRSLATVKGNDTYTTAAIKARPDKQGANWQGSGSDPLWQSIYSELDRLETRRAGQ